MLHEFKSGDLFLKAKIFSDGEIVNLTQISTKIMQLIQQNQLTARAFYH